MRRYVFHAKPSDMDGAQQPEGGFPVGALEGPALAGHGARADHGARAEALAAHQRRQHVQRPAHRRLVHEVLRSVSGVEDPAPSCLEREVCHLY